MKLGNMEIPNKNDNECSRHVDVASGKSKKPVLTKLSTETEDDARNGVGYSIFKKADNKAQNYIVTSEDEQPLQSIMNCDTAKDMWDKLLSV